MKTRRAHRMPLSSRARSANSPSEIWRAKNDDFGHSAASRGATASLSLPVVCWGQGGKWSVPRPIAEDSKVEPWNNLRSSLSVERRSVACSLRFFICMGAITKMGISQNRRAPRNLWLAILCCVVGCGLLIHADTVRSLGIGRSAFISIIEKEKLPLSLEGFGRYDDPATDDVMMARYRPTPNTTAVSLGMWGRHDNLRAVDVECYRPITRGLSKYERELCVTLMALVLKLTLPEWVERNAWLGKTMSAGHTRKDVILKRDGRQIRFFATSTALGVEVAALKQD